MVDVDAAALLAEAEAARAHAYAPYSRFRVGAAVLTADGQVHRGVNVENVSYGLTICAERVAIGAAVAAGAREVVAVAVIAGDDAGGGDPPAPCGACRQVLHEFGPDMQVILPGASPRVRPLSDYLPSGFGPRDLARGQEEPA